MESVGIRDLRGAALRENAHKGEPLAITSRRVLIGVLIPAASGWVEHLIRHNWVEVGQNLTEGEEILADATYITALEDVVPEPDGSGPGGGAAPQVPGKLAVPLAAAVVNNTVTQTSASRETVEQLQQVLNPLGSSVVRTIRTIRVGDLSAAEIEKAGGKGEALAVTNDRALIGILIPVTRGLVEFLIEQNIDKVIHHIRQGEKELKTELYGPGKMLTLDGLSPRPIWRSAAGRRLRGGGTGDPANS
jgi:hypothetical protein